MISRRTFLATATLVLGVQAVRPVSLSAADTFVTVHGLRLHVLDSGGNTPPLILLHGIARHAHTFDHVTPDLSRSYRVIAVDMRGHGDSAWSPDGAYLVEDYVKDLEVDARARELEIRESLLKAHEKRIQSKVEELKEVESRITVATRAKDDAESARFKNIVTMYENMKPKDAARIFDRLDMATLFDVASNMKPQKLSDVLAQMQSETAERLTVELARRGGAERVASPSDLPKIEGRPASTN